MPGLPPSVSAWATPAPSPSRSPAIHAPTTTLLMHLPRLRNVAVISLAPSHFDLPAYRMHFVDLQLRLQGIEQSLQVGVVAGEIIKVIGRVIAVEEPGAVGDWAGYAVRNPDGVGEGPALAGRNPALDDSGIIGTVVYGLGTDRREDCRGWCDLFRQRERQFHVVAAETPDRRLRLQIDQVPIGFDLPGIDLFAELVAKIAVAVKVAGLEEDIALGVS